MAASTQGDGNAKVGIVNHVNTLGDALQTISENAIFEPSAQTRKGNCTRALTNVNNFTRSRSRAYLLYTTS